MIGGFETFFLLGRRLLGGAGWGCLESLLFCFLLTQSSPFYHGYITRFPSKIFAMSRCYFISAATIKTFPWGKREKCVQHKTSIFSQNRVFSPFFRNEQNIFPSFPPPHLIAELIANHEIARDVGKHLEAQKKILASAINLSIVI